MYSVQLKAVHVCVLRTDWHEQIKWLSCRHKRHVHRTYRSIAVAVVAHTRWLPSRIAEGRREEAPNIRSAMPMSTELTETQMYSMPPRVEAEHELTLNLKLIC